MGTDGMTAVLNREGYAINSKRVRKPMQMMGIRQSTPSLISVQHWKEMRNIPYPNPRSPASIVTIYRAQTLLECDPECNHACLLSKSCKSC